MSARWYELRRASNTQPKTYRCPICGAPLPALSEHVLLFPEGDHSRRRHAHVGCVRSARARGELPTKAEWQAAQRKREPSQAAREPSRSGREPSQAADSRPRRWFRR